MIAEAPVNRQLMLPCMDKRSFLLKPRLLEPSGQQGHIIAVGVVFNGFAQVRVRPSDDHIVTLEPGHDSYSILAATPDRHLHS
jgi:hypothetical protein